MFSSVNDLLGLLIFLRFEPFASTKHIWQSLITSNKHEFRKLFKWLALRHSKQCVRDELKLPAQRRYVITMPFTPIEEPPPCVINVNYYDVLPLMGLGAAKQKATLNELLQESDFVTLHVPELEETKNLISTAQFEQMRKGSYLLNASRGSVVDIPALITAMKSGKVSRAGLDVFNNEPNIK